MDPVLVGYFAKEPPNPAEAEFLGPGEDIGSVAECIVSGAESWIQHWKHNKFWRFDSEQLALSVVPVERRASFDVYAYESYPLLFDVDGEQPLEMPQLDVEPVGSDYSVLGYDVVELRSIGRPGDEQPNYEFGCSPLTCNSLLKEMRVNAHCLLETAAEALELAGRVAASDGTMGEPGPYVAVRVLRKNKPGAR
jgi:hypothetical protein